VEAEEKPTNQTQHTRGKCQQSNNEHNRRKKGRTERVDRRYIRKWHEYPSRLISNSNWIMMHLITIKNGKQAREKRTEKKKDNSARGVWCIVLVVI